MSDAPFIPDLYISAMVEALELARESAVEDEVPVGAVVVEVASGRIVGRGRDRKMIEHDPTSHAEMTAMREAAAALGDWRLEGCVLVVTLEPCPMCAGAAVMARVDGIVYGASNPKFGAAGTLMNVPGFEGWNHRLWLYGGLMAEECGGIMKEYFRGKRKTKPVGGDYL